MSGTSASELDYETAATALAGTRPWTSPAELQGLLCGAIAGGGEPGDDAWLQIVWSHAGEDPAAEGLHAELAAFRAAAADNFGAEDFGFRLLIPSDERALNERVEALASWCAAFLSGFGLAGGTREGLDDESAGALEDLAEIANADPDVNDDPDEESDFADLAEYVRMAALLIRETARAPGNASGPGDDGAGEGAEDAGVPGGGDETP